MAVVARILLWSLVPVITTLLALLTAIFTFVGSNKISSSTTSSIFFYGIDLSQVYYPLDKSSNNWTSVADAAGIYPIFLIGASGFCYGDNSGSSLVIQNCETPDVPFWFNLRQYLSEFNAEHIFDKTDSLQHFESSASIVNSKCIWSLLIIVIILSTICLGLFLIDMFYPFGAFSSIILLCTVIQVACAVTAAVLSLQNFSNVKSTFSQGIIRGNTGIGLIWTMAAASILNLAWWFASCCGSCRRNVPIDEPIGDETFTGNMSAPTPKAESYVQRPPQSSTMSTSTRYNSFSTAPSVPDRASSLSVSRVDMSHIGANAHKSPRSSRIDLTRGQTLQRRKERGISKTPQVQLLNPYRNRIPEAAEDNEVDLQRKVTMKKFKSETSESDNTR